MPGIQAAFTLCSTPHAHAFTQKLDHICLRCKENFKYTSCCKYYMDEIINVKRKTNVLECLLHQDWGIVNILIPLSFNLSHKMIKVWT